MPRGRPKGKEIKVEYDKNLVDLAPSDVKEYLIPIFRLDRNEGVSYLLGLENPYLNERCWKHSYRYGNLCYRKEEALRRIKQHEAVIAINESLLAVIEKIENECKIKGIKISNE